MTPRSRAVFDTDQAAKNKDVEVTITLQVEYKHCNIMCACMDILGL